MEEMLEDTLEGLEGDDVEDLADEEVEKVLLELTQGFHRFRFDIVPLLS